MLPVYIVMANHPNSYYHIEPRKALTIQLYGQTSQMHIWRKVLGKTWSEGVFPNTVARHGLNY